MTDIARLGVAMDTKQLRDGKAALDALVPSAQKAEKGIDRFNAAASGGSGGMRSFGAAVSGVNGQVRLMGNGVDFLTGKVNTNFVAINKAISSWNQAKASLSGIPAAASGAASSLNRLGAAANDNINRLQSTPGNIAAQFQDIGVTAAGGMNPLLIALQQGTQLSSAMQGGIGNLLAGLRQLFNLTTVLTVAFVALLAAGLQMVDWMRVAETLANGLADGMDMLADFVEDASVALVYFTAVSIVAFGPRLLSMVLSLAASIGTTLYGMIGRATVAMIVFASANPFGAIVIAIGLVITAMALLNDRFGGVFTNILNTVKYVANAIIRFFATAFNAVLKASDTVVNGLISSFERFSGFLGFDVSLGRVDTSGLQIDTSAGRDFVADIGAGLGEVLRSGADFARGLITPDAAAADAATASSGGRRAGGQSEAQRQAEAYTELTKRAQERINALTDETMALGMTEAAGMRFLAQQELLRDAASRGIVLDKARTDEIMRLGDALASAEIDKSIAQQTRAYQEQLQTLQDQADLIGLTGRELVETATFQDMLAEAVRNGAVDLKNMNEEMRRHILILRERAATIADQTEANARGEFIAEFARNLDMQTAAMERARGEIGLFGPALTAYRIESELLNRAARENITLTEQDIAGLRAKAIEHANVTEAVRLQQERYDDARDSLRGFFSDMVNGLQQGQSVWEVFGNAVMRIVNRIIDRLINNGTDSLLGSLGQLFGALGGGPSKGLLGSVNNTIASNPQLFAKGGAFTNGVYDNPTLFKFAKGGAFGVMGEAGPEAVMPLKRGSDGSLGVRVTAMEPQEVIVRVITDDDRFDAYVDTRIGVNAPQVAQAGAIVSERNRAFKNSRRLA